MAVEVFLLLLLLLLTTSHPLDSESIQTHPTPAPLCLAAGAEPTTFPGARQAPRSLRGSVTEDSTPDSLMETV